MEEPRDKVSAYAQARGMTMDVLLDTNGAVNNAWSIAYTPTVFVVGRDGRLIARAVGNRAWSAPDGRAFLDALLSP